MNLFTLHLSGKIEAICKEHLPAEAKAEWEKYWGPFDDAIFTHQRITGDVAATFSRNKPPGSNLGALKYPLPDLSLFHCHAP